MQKNNFCNGDSHRFFLLILASRSYSCLRFKVDVTKTGVHD